MPSLPTHLPYTGTEPTRGTAHSAGLDLRSAGDVRLDPLRWTEVLTDTAVAIPEGHVGLVRGRSGLAFRRGIIAFEGTIDNDYRGRIGVMLCATGQRHELILEGDRIAQLVIVPYLHAEPVRVAALPDTARGAKGFGSTGR